MPKDNESRGVDEVETQADNVTPEPIDSGPGSRLSVASLTGADLSSVLTAAQAAKDRCPDWFLASLLEDTLPSTLMAGLAATDGRHELMGVGFWDVQGINRVNSRLDVAYVIDQVAMIRLFELNDKTDTYATQK